MCGICGILNKNNPHTDMDMLKRMVRVLQHRGPDGEGLYNNKHIALGHRRLSVIDLSENAAQPMSNEEGTVWIVFNGMIYNYSELTEGLKKKGHRFKSKSDTEAILHLYEELGAGCVKYLRGMFAFAIWDSRTHELILARDRIGQKPLVYTETKDYFLFASEPKSILASGIFKAEVNPVSFHHLFSYVSVPYPNTMFKGIFKLPPAAVMTVKNGNIQIERYWKPEFGTIADIKEKNALQKLNNLVDESVRLRLISDVPTGTFLSGGIDSSIITVFANSNAPKPIKAFSVGFEDDNNRDAEFPYAKSVAERYGIEYKKVVVREDVIDEMERMIWHYDEPFSLPEALVNMRFCREVKKEVKVALTGDGGDEIFAGYSGYFLWKMIGDIDILMRNNKAARAAFIPTVHALIKIFSNKMFKVLLLPAEDKRAFVKNLAATATSGRLYSEQFKRLTSGIDVGEPLKKLYLDSQPQHILDGVLFMDLVLNDSHSTGMFSDISGMANGLELRAPFLDHNIVEFAATLPVWLKIRGKTRKYILKELGKSILPKNVISRRKFGFAQSMPLDKWILEKWRGRIEDSLFNTEWNEDGYIDQRSVRVLCEDHFSRRKNNLSIVWLLYCYSKWHEIFIKGVK